MSRLLLLTPLLLLAACGQRDKSALPADDERALNDAAASLDDNAIAAPSDDQGNAQ